MRISIILLFLTFGYSSYSQKVKITTDHMIEVIVWQGSKMIHHHVMNPNDELWVDKSEPFLIPWKVPGIKLDPHMVKLTPYGYVEHLFNLEIEREYCRKNWLSHVTEIHLIVNETITAFQLIERA